ncbi:hypothetical protein EVJ58_g4867 [Rhodofomes roseus]|uniref:Threonine synthase N-terminal domain-containing protein n=1 Tax=Rhodofomes roseus TaxID=34475 RepID=A0A4Y9YG89_9APHY|nr:hypothetical protein EVJ58_g4867 [Rhodofomes roseus]
MRYFSTRGAEQLLSFEETVLTGLAPNGGLYIPERIPSLPADWEERWRDYSFQDLSVEILSLYISPSEISRDELRTLVDKSYSTFRHPEISPLKQLSDKTYVLELFHGPTFAFKDVALQLLGNLFEFFLVRRNSRKGPGEKREKLTVVGATSGDTGRGRVSPIQEAQMTTVADANVHNLAVRGTFDDCQDAVKALFADTAFNARHRLGAVNSINWARILAQTVYYFLAHFHARRAHQLPQGAQLQFVVPTGNFGDVLAGYYAKRMGLPMGKLVIATNANDILARFWRSGAYEKVDSAPSPEPRDGHPRLEQLERLLWYLAYEEQGASADDAARVRAACATVDSWMRAVKVDGRVQVPTAVLEAARRDFVAERISDEQTLETIRSYYGSSPPYIADPHTAVGLCAAGLVSPHNAPSTVQVVLSTAHPAKFSEAVTRALAGEPSFDFAQDVLPEEFRGLLERERRVEDVPNDIEAVKAVIERYVGDGRAAVEKGASV